MKYFKLSRTIPIFSFLALAALFFIHCELLAASPSSDSKAAFQSHLNKMQKAAGQVGLEVISLSTGKAVLEYNEKEGLTPASLTKILTSYAALKELGPYYHFTTSLWGLGPLKGDTLQGNIWIKSEGDIFLVGEKVWTLARMLKESGIGHIQGGIYVDNSYFDPATERICLDGKCEKSYNPVLSATAFDFNTVTFHILAGQKAGSPLQVSWSPEGSYVELSNVATTGSKTAKARLDMQPLGTSADGREKFQLSGKLPAGSAKSYEYRFNADDPAAFVARSFKAALKEAGIDVRGTALGSQRAPQGAGKLATYESPPLADLLYGLNRYSNNFMAEMLVRSLGAAVAGAPATIEKGTSAVLKTLRESGIPEGQIFLDSGSGLSRRCKVTPEAFCRVLADAYRDFSIGPEFLASFAMNAKEGTLKKRMHEPGTIVRGKTGTLSDVVGFAGYVSGPDKRVYAVAVLLNEVKNVLDARDAVDSFLEELPAMGD